MMAVFLPIIASSARGERRQADMTTEIAAAPASLMVRRLLEDVFSSPNPVPAHVAALVSETYVLDDESYPDTVSGPAGVIALLQRLHRAYPDVRFTIDEQVTLGDLVVTHWHSQCANAGRIVGISAQPDILTYQGHRCSRVRDGKLVSERVHWDTLSLLDATRPSANPAAVRRALGADVAAAGELLARAFQDDPMYQYVAPDPLQRAAILPAYCAAVARYGHLFGELHLAGRPPVAAAIWVPPGAADITAEQMEAAAFGAATAVMKAEVRGRLFIVGEYLRALRRQLVPWPHWYLMMVGVDPSAQGRGIGSRLLRPVLTRADAEGVVCALETTQTRNLPFYAGLGFEVVDRGVAPGTDLSYWLMQRLPQSQ